MNKKTIFFHVDIDAFYASVEQIDNPQYKGKPVIVGGNTTRSVVTTCSYEAREFGVHSAMPMIKAQQLCPDGIFIKPRMKRYHEKSKEVMLILENFAPHFQQISIDEAFINMSGMEKLLGSPWQAAKTLKSMIYEKTNLTVSIGCGSNKYIAKIASGKSKPNGLFIVPSGWEAEFMKSLPLKDIWGIGKKTQEKLTHAGLSDINKILKTSKNILKTIVGDAGSTFLYNAVRGEPAEIFSEDPKYQSISTERTFEYDIFSNDEIDDMLFYLSNELMYRVIDENIKSNTIAIKIRYNNFKTVSIQSTEKIICDGHNLFTRSKKLFYKKFDGKTPIRLLGIAVINTEEKNKTTQSDLFYSEADTKKRKIEEIIHNISKKEGKIILTPARMIEKDKG